jgi:hypothetical protein
MKKLLVILMVVAMAAFLFVGCIPDVVTPPVDEEEEEEEEEVVTTTVAPIITSITDNPATGTAAAVISLTSTATQYMNAADVALGIIVSGTAPTFSEVKVYIDDVCAGTADVGASGTFSVVVAKVDLGSDEDKVLYATAKEAALPVSPKSTEYAFTLDTVRPTATTLAATAAAANAVDSAIVSGSGAIDSAELSGVGTLVAGAYTINCLGDSTEVSNVVVTTPAGVSTTYSIGTANYLNLGIIPGVELDFQAGFAAGDACTVTVTTAIASRATVLFDEEITFATAATGANYTWSSWDLSLNAANAITASTFVNYAVLTSYFTPVTGTLAIARYDTLNCVVNGMTDLAGNTQIVANVLSCTVGAASATSLVP